MSPSVFRRQACLSLAFCALLSACASVENQHVGSATSAPTASIVATGLLNCFPAELTDEEGRPVTCELSAVAKSGRELVFVSDDPVPGPERSAVFAMQGTADGVVEGSLRYLTNAEFLAARKFEAMTATPDGTTILISTAFDRAEPAFAGGDAYNLLLAWRADRENEVEIVAQSIRSGVASSLPVRERLSRALASEAFPEGPPYFKVEGLAALPDGRLLFGIREVGRNYKDFEYTMKIVSGSYEVTEEGVKLGNDFKLIYDFDTSQVAALNGKEVGLSGLEYDPLRRGLYMLTSYEPRDADEGLSGFLWMLSLEDLDAGRPPLLVFGDDGQPFTFAHKPEGLAVIDAEHLLAVYDDDRVLSCDQVGEPEVQVCRKAHQAFFSIVRLRASGSQSRSETRFPKFAGQ